MNSELRECSFREGRHYIIDPATGCWNWQLFKNRGYARAANGSAYRRAYEEIVGPIPEKHDLHHVCENPACINPDHLEPLRHGEHLIMHWKDRGLPAEQLEEIKRLLRETTLSVKQIAERLGLPRTTVNNIAQGRHSAVGENEELRPARDCLLCGKPVPVERRRSARFCCVEHRVTYNGRKLTERRRLARQEGFRN